MLIEVLLFGTMELVQRYLHPERYVLPPEPDPEDSRDAVASRLFAGRQGTTLTVLRPVGTVIIDGEPVTARSQGGFISEGRSVTVLRVESDELIVKATTDAGPP